MAQINVKVPSSEDSGYLRRMIRLAEIQDAISRDRSVSGDISAPSLLKLVDFIAEFAIEVMPDEGEDLSEFDVRDALMDLSQDRYMEIMDALGSVSIPKETDTASKSSTQEG